MSNPIKIKKNLLKDYTIKDIIGKGTFSVVKLGIDKKTNEKVAIKILEKRKMTNKKDIIRVEREIDILKSIEHINVIKVYKILQDPDKIYIIMEYCENGELFKRIIDKKKLPEEECSFFYFQLINGLEYLHSKDIIHRDLKPENLLLTKYDTLKIIDFGLSNYNTYDNLLSTPCGSPCYASPEMITGEKYNGFMLDIWSSGIILYAMIYGTLPFEDCDNNTDLLFKTIYKCKIKFNKSFCNLGVDLLKKILVPDPKKRYDIPQIKNHPFYKKGKTVYLYKQKLIKDEMENNNLINCGNNFVYKIMINKLNNTEYKSIDNTNRELENSILNETILKNRMRSHNKTTSENSKYKEFKSKIENSMEKNDDYKRNMSIIDNQINSNYTEILENVSRKRKNKLNLDKIIRINIKGMIQNNNDLKKIEDNEKIQHTSRDMGRQNNFPNVLSIEKKQKYPVKNKSNCKNLKIMHSKNDMNNSIDQNSKIIFKNKINNYKINTSFFTYKTSKTMEETNRNTFDSYCAKNYSNNNPNKKKEMINSIESKKGKKTIELSQELNQSYAGNCNNTYSDKQRGKIINSHKLIFYNKPHKTKSQLGRQKLKNSSKNEGSPGIKRKKIILNYTLSNSTKQNKYKNQNDNKLSYRYNKYKYNNDNNIYNKNYENDFEINYENDYDNDYYSYNNKYNNNSIKIITDNQLQNNSLKSTPKTTGISRNQQDSYKNNNLIVINKNIINNIYNNNKIVNVNYRNIPEKKRNKLINREIEEKFYRKFDSSRKRDNMEDYNSEKDNKIYIDDNEKKKEVKFSYKQNYSGKRLLGLSSNVSKISTIGMINMYKANISTIPCFTIDMNNLNKNNDKYQKYYDAIKNKL